MKQIPFGGMLCNPINITKEGDFKIKGVISNNGSQEIARYEYFASMDERDKRYNMIMNLLKEII